MKLSLKEAAQRMGMSPRQVRYRIQDGRLTATKVANRWLIDEGDLPDQDGKRAERRDAKAASLEVAVEAAVQAQLRKYRTLSVTDLKIFQRSLACWKAAGAILAPDHPACEALAACNIAITTGSHVFHRRDKAEAFRAARHHACSAVAWLHMVGTEESVALAERLEEEVLPPLAGLLRRNERRVRP